MDSMVLVEIANRYIVDFVPRPLSADQYSRQIEAGFRSSSQTVHNASFNHRRLGQLNIFSQVLAVFGWAIALHFYQISVTFSVFKRMEWTVRESNRTLRAQQLFFFIK